MGCCLLALLSWLSPRLILVFEWVFTNRLSVAFNSFVVGFVGFLILPYTTVVYSLAYAPGRGVQDIGWLLVGIALLVDVASWGGGDRARRRRD